jgi:hypothetical protein
MNPTPINKLPWLILLLVFWAFYGLVGRDAWKAEEALALAPILDWLEGLISVWSTPAPLYTLVSGAAIKFGLAGGDMQSAARLASGGFICIALLFTGLGARAQYGPGFGSAAAIALVGGFGLMLRAHALLPETALLAAWSILLYGVSAGLTAGVNSARRRPASGIWAIGLALAMLTLGLRGIPDLLAGLAIILLSLLSPAGRDRASRKILLRGVLLAAGLIALGMLVLLVSGNLSRWWQWHGLAQFAAARMPQSAFSELPWFAWPLWPLALAGVWHAHRRLARTTELHLPLIAVGVLLIAALIPAWSRDGALLPVLLPLALLSAYGLDNLRRGAAQAFYWFGVLFFACFLVAIWVYFAALEWGYPATIARHMARLAPNYTPGAVGFVTYALAALATLVWFIAIPLFPRAKIRPILVWATGMILLWVLIASLFRPWAESGWAYRPMIAKMARQLPAGACLNTDVDPAMQTMLRLHLKVPTRVDCPWTLKLVTREDAKLAKAQGDNVVWQGFRQRQKMQVYRLEHHEPGQP